MKPARPQTPEDAPATVLAPFKYPIFRSVWLASLASNFGGMIQSVGAAWLMTSIAPSADMVTLIQASVTLPIMLLSLTAGALADNLDRRLIMLTAQIFMLVVSLVLAIFAWADLLTPWLLVLFTFLVACGTALNAPAWQATVGDMVSREDLPNAVMLNSMGFNIARSLGPALGGAIVAAAGAAAAFTLNMVSYIGLIFVLVRWRPPQPTKVLPPEPLGMAIVSGIRYVAMSPHIGIVLLRGAAFGAGAASVPALMPLIARDLIAGGPVVYGLLLGAFGAGAVGGALTSAKLRQLMSPEAIVRASCVALAAAALVAASSAVLWLTMAALVAAGAGWVLTLATFNVAVQMSAPRWVVARALSLYQMAAFGGMAAGSWCWGHVAEGFGLQEALFVSAASLLACAALGIWLGLPQFSRANLDPLDRWQVPEVAVDIEPQSGPVVITIEYLIRQEDVVTFLRVMAERRRIRRRDGARNWMLLRDLHNPQLWIERYSTPTWLDYIRHNRRTTHADVTTWERIRALHQGAEPPRVHRMIERQTGSLSSLQGAVPDHIAEPLTDPHRSS